MATKYVYFFGAGKADGKGNMKVLTDGEAKGRSVTCAFL